MQKIPFNKPFLTGKEIEYIQRAVESGKISGDGEFTKLCQNFFTKKYNFHRCLLTSSCTDALEMAALLLNIKEGDEVIMPSYTFVSTANAFLLRGAKIVFCDSQSDHPNIDEQRIEQKITSKTKAIVPVHYAGIACDMDKIIEVASHYKISIVEDAAQAIDARYKNKPLGGLGSLATFSFHETKNINCGEGGMLVVNDQNLASRAEIIREKGTNRSAFFRGEIDKYNWVDIGSSFLVSDLNAAYLYAQLEQLQLIQEKRIGLWNMYNKELKELSERGIVRLPTIPEYATNNGHIFYLLCGNADERAKLISYLKDRGILAIFHYQSLHQSPFFKKFHDGDELPNSDFYSSCLIRLPLFHELSEDKCMIIINAIRTFYFKR